MPYPKIKISKCDYAQITQNKTGDLAMVYKPLQNLIKNSQLGAFTTENLKFNRHNAQDMIIVDEFDGSTNIIINDDENNPKLINSGFAVQEDNTFLIPEHYTNVQNNIFDDQTLNQDTQLFKLYNSIPNVEFQGLGTGGFKCGSYIFYFRLSDSHGNMSNVVQHSSIVQIYVGQLNSYKVRMGMQDEDAGKSVKFLLNGIDSGFDYIRVFYERTSTSNDQASSTLFYMIDQNFPISDGKCSILLTGEESTLPISIQDLKNEYADIASCKTHTVVDNTLFMANVSGFVHDYKALQHLAWTIYAEQSTDSMTMPDTAATGSAEGYYKSDNVYNYVGYWPDEYYRFGVVFIYNNNQLSPVFNIQGHDLNYKFNDIAEQRTKLWNSKEDAPDTYYFHDAEPDNFIFHEDCMANSKGVVRLTDQTEICKNKSEATLTTIRFNTEGLNIYLRDSNDLTDSEREKYCIDKSQGLYDVVQFLKEVHGIKGFFFVRQKRIPTTIAQGVVVGLTKKGFGQIPILKNGSWKTKSFIGADRLLHEVGSTIAAPDENVVCKALLVPDAELQEATFNSIFTSQEFTLIKEGNISFTVDSANNWWEFSDYKPNNSSKNKVLSMLTAVPKDTKIITNGEDYFSSIAGVESESYKTENVKYAWNKTVPQILTKSKELIRGRWGYYVGMSTDAFEFGDVVSIKPDGFINNPNQNLLEFQIRFSDYSFYSPISTRYNVDYLENVDRITCFGGDCYVSLFTHRMMNNFIDHELPTNTRIVDPACWAKNYLVRCTAEVMADTHSNLTGDSAGFYIPSPATKASSIVSLIFGILTGNLGMVIQSAVKLAKHNADGEKEKLLQDEFANEITQAFEMYVGKSLVGENAYKPGDDPYDTDIYDEDDPDSSDIKNLVANGNIKKINPTEQEQGAGGLNLKAIFKSDDKWEMHGLAQINRADVNAVTFGQWITFPIRSSMNLALRDVDFNQATEEASFNKKRSFYPLEPMDIANKLPESNVINGAAKKSIHKNAYPAYKTVPFIKQEYFNRIYWSKPNVSESFLNSFRMVYTDQYKEYNKEFGDITKILPLGNTLFVCFDHGMGVLPIDRTTKTEAEASPYLASRNVLPPQVQTLSKDFGSMWKNSVIQTPKGLIYGVDTVAKKIWRTQGSQVEFISDHKVSKFLNEWIKLSEFDYKAYQGHIDVKTHYNNFKNDVIFTFVKDVPDYTWNENTTDALSTYIQNIWGSGKQDWVAISDVEQGGADGKIIVAFGTIPETASLQIASSGEVRKLSRSDRTLTQSVLQKYSKVEIENGQTIFTFSNNNTITLEIVWDIKYTDIQQGKVYVNDLFSGIRLDIKSWNPGPVWSLCYNEVLGKFVTFYDWYPVESCNVDNIFFTFDQEQIDKVYDNNQIENGITYPKLDDSLSRTIQNKYFIDQTFTDKATVYRIPTGHRETFSSGKSYFSCYYKTSGTISTTGNKTGIYKKVLDGWTFEVWKISNSTIRFSASSDMDIIEPKLFDLPIDPETNEQYSITKYISVHSKESESLKYYDIRDYNPNRMYLWKHGYGGLYNNQGKIKPTNWYGKQREFNFEFIVHDSSMVQKIFNNLKMISNKTQPKKFEYEIVGESYEWWPYKPVIQWINEKTEEGLFTTLQNGYQYVLTNDVATIRSNVDYSDFPVTDLEYRSNVSPYVYSKLPYLKIELTDKYGRQDKSYHPDTEDYWKLIRPRREVKPREHDYSFNTNETVIKYDEQLNEYRIHDEQLGNDMWKYGRVRGNMQYLEDYWNIEIRPVNFKWCYIKDEKIQFKEISEARHRDKYIKIKVRYSGEDLAVIQAIATLYNESYS